MRTKVLMTAVIYLCFSTGAALAAGVWSGKVIDSDTGQSLAKASICAGIKGRVDLACTTSDGSGAFSIGYSQQWWDDGGKDMGDYYLYIESPQGSGTYFNQVRRRSSPGKVTAKLVPRYAFIKGKAVKAGDGSPAAGVEVALVEPGRIDRIAKTDGNGNFAFDKISAFQNSKLQFNTYGVPQSELPKKHDPPLKYRAWGVMAPYGAGDKEYTRVQPKPEGQTLVPAIPLKNSSTGHVYTRIDLRLPKPGTKIIDVNEYYKSGIIGANK